MSEVDHDEARDLLNAWMRECLSPPDAWWYVSFADPERPEGQQFLGGAYVRGSTAELALARAWSLGINPGGQPAMAGPFPAAAMDANGVPETDRERLLTRSEVEQH